MRNPWQTLTIQVPEQLPNEIKRRIRNRYTAEQAAKAALDSAILDAGDISSTLRDPGAIHGRGRPSDPTARAADRIAEARAELERVRAWEMIFEEADRIYPADSDVGKAVHFVYHCGWSQTEAAKMITGGNDRQAVKARLDRYVGACYDLAIRSGMLKREGES